ncbi:MAG: hypothetical protein DLM72_04935 [Candidatus Nitrosopolaris wilkensis]|nr:MAG: hypothetical protein DLM72_04935 [Candidatus Nitrosopolaris wilkensis]
MSIAGHHMFHIYILPVDASMALNDLFFVDRRKLRMFSGGLKNYDVDENLGLTKYRELFCFSIRTTFYWSK